MVQLGEHGWDALGRSLKVDAFRIGHNFWARGRGRTSGIAPRHFGPLELMDMRAYASKVGQMPNGATVTMPATVVLINNGV